LPRRFLIFGKHIKGNLPAFCALHCPNAARTDDLRCREKSVKAITPPAFPLQIAVTRNFEICAG